MQKICTSALSSSFNTTLVDVRGILAESASLNYVTDTVSAGIPDHFNVNDAVILSSSGMSTS